MAKRSAFDFLYADGKDGQRYYQKQPFESRRAGSMELPEVRQEPKAQIWMTMLQSPAFASLSGQAFKMYCLMRLQAFSLRKNKGRQADGYKLQGTEFEFSWRLCSKCYPGTFTRKESFYKARQELVEKGFIRQCSSGRYEDGRRNGKPIIWDLDWKWQVWPQKN